MALEEKKKKRKERRKKEKKTLNRAVNVTYPHLNGRNPFVSKRDVVDEIIIKLIVVEVAG